MDFDAHKAKKIIDGKKEKNKQHLISSLKISQLKENKDRREFEIFDALQKYLWSSAKRGKSLVVWDTSIYPISNEKIDYLRGLGFLVKQIHLREGYLAWLEGRVLSEQKNLAALANRISIENPASDYLNDVGSFHLNPLISLCQKLWESGLRNKAQFSEIFSNSQSSDRLFPLSESDNLFSEIPLLLDLFFSVRMLEEKLSEVKYENNLIPRGIEGGLLVSWDQVEATDKYESQLKPSVLKFVSESWIEVMSSIEGEMKAQLDSGLESMELSLSSSHAIFLDENEDWSYREICAPLLVIDELYVRGFSVNLAVFYLNSKIDTVTEKEQIRSSLQLLEGCLAHLEVSVGDQKIYDLLTFLEGRDRQYKSDAGVAKIRELICMIEGGDPDFSEQHVYDSVGLRIQIAC
jgi:hypothetical protein